MRAGAVRLARASALTAVALALVVALFANLLVSRHYTRWDVTATQRYTLSPATLETLHHLPEPVHVWVLMSQADPLAQSVKQTLIGYQAESALIEVRFIDPERDAVGFEAARKRFKIEVGRADEGQIVTDAVMVVFLGDRYRYVRADDLLEVTSGNEARVKPREEQAITTAIRGVLSGDKSSLCFVRGHGEMGLDDGGESGLGFLKDLLEKDNYLAKSIELGAPGVKAPLDGCDVVVVAGPKGAFSRADVDALSAHLARGKHALFALGPVLSRSEHGLEPLGLDELLATRGIGLDEDVIVETDPAHAFEAGGIGFVAQVKPHSVTSGLVGESDKATVPRVKIKFARSLRAVVTSSGTAATTLLTTSDGAYGLVDLRGAADWNGPPAKGPADRSGPLLVAMASETPYASEPKAPAPGAPLPPAGAGAAKAEHGSRVVVLGASSPLFEQNFREGLSERGAALLVESAISWLAAKPIVVDIPEKSVVTAGLHITEESRQEVRRYVLILMPAGVLLLGLALFFSRRSREGAPHVRST